MMAVKVSGYRNLDSLVAWAGSKLVDIGYVSHEGPRFALISPDDDDMVRSREDFDWFRDLVRDTLRDSYDSDVNVYPEPVDPADEDGLLEVDY